MNTPLASTLTYLSTRYPPSLSVKQVAEITSSSSDSIRNAVSRGSYPIPSFKLGRRRLFRLVDVAAHLDDQLEATNHAPKNDVPEAAEDGTRAYRPERRCANDHC